MPSTVLGIIHSCDSQQSHIWIEAVKAPLLNVFKEDLTNFLVKLKSMRHDLMEEAQYPWAPTSTAKKGTDQPFDLIAQQSGSYFLNLVACHDSMFSSHGPVSSKTFTVFVDVE